MAWFPLTAALAVAYLAVALAGPRMVGLWQDDAVYVVTAQSLAQGTGYRHLEMPHQPLQTKYPPLFPLMLSAVMRGWRSYPDNLPALHAVTAIAGAALVLLGWWYATTVLGMHRRLATVVAALSAISPVLVCMNRFLMSELPYAALAAGAMLVLDRFCGADRRSSPGRLAAAGCGVLIVLTMMTRTFGITLAAAGVGVLLWRRRWGQAAMVAAMAATAMLAYGLWQHQAAAANGWVQSAPLYSYDLDYRSWIPRSPGALLQVIWQNGLRTLMGLGAFQLALPKDWVTHALRRFGPATVVLHAVCLLAGGLWATGFVSTLLRRGLQSVHLYSLAYGAMMLAWPCEPFRFLVPWVPFILYFVLEGTAEAGRGLSRFVSGVPLPLVVCGILAILFVVEDRQILTSTRESYYLWGNRVDDLDQLDELKRWIVRDTPPEAVFASPRTSDLYIATGRHFVQAWVHDDPVNEYYDPGRAWWSFSIKGVDAEQVRTYRRMRESLWRMYRQAGADYAIWDGTVRVLDPVRHVAREQGDRFALRFVSSRQVLAVYEVLPEPQSQPGTASQPAPAPQPDPPAAAGG